jgi:predicted amidophosphoribosyltransferase
MSLVACPACAREISKQAAACPHCGQPMNDSGKVVTVQATRKLYKAIMVAGALLMIAGVASCVMALPEKRSTFQGSTLFISGLLVFLGARILAWWHHE